MRLIKTFESFKINEGAPNYKLQSKVEKTEAYNKMSSKFKQAIDEFLSDIKNEIGYEEGDTDDDRAIGLSIQSAIDRHYGW